MQRKLFKSKLSEIKPGSKFVILLLLYHRYMVSESEMEETAPQRINIPAPQALNLCSGNRNRNFDVFKQSWLNYELATDLEMREMKKRVATLLTIIGTEALEVFNTFEWQNEEQTIDNILSKFEVFCKPKKNVTYERFLLLTRRQKESERIDDYARNLRTLAETCEFGVLKNSLIKDAFVLGILDNKVRENLLKDCDLTLDTAINIARAHEKAREQSSIIGSTDANDVMKIHKTQSNHVKTVMNCKFCGKEHQMIKSQCPAFGKFCKKCKGKNHFAEKCKSQIVRNVECDDTDKEDTEDFYVQ